MEENLDFENGLFNLVDEDGNESAFELLGSVEIDDVTYVALVPAENEDDEYVLLKVTTDEDGSELLVTIDDDDEFDRSPRLKRNSSARSIWTTTRTRPTTEPRNARKIGRFCRRACINGFDPAYTNSVFVLLGSCCSMLKTYIYELEHAFRARERRPPAASCFCHLAERTLEAQRRGECTDLPKQGFRS